MVSAQRRLGSSRVTNSRSTTDGRNLRNLFEYADLRAYMRLFYEHSLLGEALNPGWPRQTAGRALGLWIGWLGGGERITNHT